MTQQSIFVFDYAMYVHNVHSLSDILYYYLCYNNLYRSKCMFTYVQWFRFIQNVLIMLNVKFFTNKSFSTILSIFCNDELLSCLFEKSLRDGH